MGFRHGFYPFGRRLLEPGRSSIREQEQQAAHDLYPPEDRTVVGFTESESRDADTPGSLTHEGGLREHDAE